MPESQEKTVTLALDPSDAIGVGSPSQGTVTIAKSSVIPTQPTVGIPPVPSLPPAPGADLPLSAAISKLKISGGLTGDQTGSFKIGNDTKQVSFTKLYSVTVAITAAATNGTVDSITVTGGSQPLVIQCGGAANGTFQGNVQVASEGVLTLFATVSAKNDNGDTATASLPDGQEQILVVDRTPPSLAYTLPDRHSSTDDKDLVYLNGSTEGLNSVLRAGNRSNCWNASDFTIGATISSLCGLKTDGNLATISGPAAADLTVTVYAPTDTQPNYTISVTAPPELDESIEFGVDTDVLTDIIHPDSDHQFYDITETWKDPFKVKTYRGYYHFGLTLEDRCGNVLNTGDAELADLYEFKIWVDRTPPPAAVGMNVLNGNAETTIFATDDYPEVKSGGVASPLFRIARAPIDHVNKTSYIFSKNAWFVVSTYDAAEAWQEGTSPQDWMHVAYHHPTSLATLISPLPHIFAEGMPEIFKQANPNNPANEPDEKWVIESELTPFVLKRPIKNLTGGIMTESDVSGDDFGMGADDLIIHGPLHRATPQKINVIIRDAAGNYSNQASADQIKAQERLINVRRDIAFVSQDYNVTDIDEDGEEETIGVVKANPDQGPQYSDGSNYFNPKILTVPPSFRDDGALIYATLRHPDYVNIAADLHPAQGEDPGYDLPPEDEHKSYSPMVGIAPTAFEPNWLNLYHTRDFDFVGIMLGDYFAPYYFGVDTSNFSDVYQLYPNTPGTDETSGTIRYEQDELLPDIPTKDEWLLAMRRNWSKPWKMKADMQPGLTRAFDTSVHTGYHWGNAIKLTPDVAATGNVVTLRLGAGYIKADAFDKDGNITNAGNQSDLLSATDNSFKLVDTGNYLQIGGGLVVQAGITIIRGSDNHLMQRLVPDPNEPSLLQWLEVTVEIGRTSHLTCTMYT
jgi:hypothetical protein